MLTLQNIYAGYGGPDVIKNIHFTVKRNETLLIIGPNGCGKTTLLKTIMGLLPFRGNIHIDGQSLRNMKQREISQKMAMLSQMSGTYFPYTVFDTVMMGRYLHMRDSFFKIPSNEDRHSVNDCLASVGLAELKDTEITKLSGGQLQRVFLARTLAQEPEIILLDEPTNHLDLKYQFELIEHLKVWSKQGSRSVIGILHDLNLAMRLGDRILIMKDGEMQGCGSPSEVVKAELLEKVYEMDVAGYMKSSWQVWEML